MNLKGKTFIVTGVRRIGKTVAIEMAKQGANLAVTHFPTKEDQRDAEFVCKECENLGIELASFPADLSKETDIKELIYKTTQTFGRLDGLVHMASPYPKTTLGEITQESFDKIMNTIAGSALLLGQAVSQEIQKNTGEDVVAAGKVVGKIKGKLIYFSDWSVLRKPDPNYSVYNAAKAAINAITVSLAKGLAPAITVNAVAPGPILASPDLTEKEDQESMATTPLAHWGGAEEVAKAVLYLLDADFVTGSVLLVDGGRSIA